MKLVITWVVSVISVIIMIPFLTLLERKVLRYIQSRKGPKKVGFLGIVQPICDGVKLVVKERGKVYSSNSYLFWFSPLLNFMFMLVLYIIFSTYFPSFSIKLGIILYLCFSSLLVYTIMASGWGSNSKYAFLGSLRGAAQIISYEVVILTLIFFPTLISNRFDLNDNNTRFSLKSLLFIIVLVFWLISIVAETNRSPFDFAEGERELVSGFKTEYSGLIFAALFLGEYGNIIFIRFLTSFLFFPNTYLIQLLFPMIVILIFLVFRGTFPRFRYDLLMNLAWKVVLPFALVLLWIIFFFLKNSVV